MRCWHAEQNASFSEDNHDQMKTIRKNEGVVLLATQDPAEPLKSKHASTYVQQVPTKIFFGDQDASRRALVDGFRLTEAEFEAVNSKLGTMKHAFLLKRPSGSVICRFDLSRRPDQIAVISGRRSIYELALRLRNQYGTDPALWVPHYERQAPLIVDDPQLQTARKRPHETHPPSFHCDRRRFGIGGACAGRRDRPQSDRSGHANGRTRRWRPSRGSSTVTRSGSAHWCQGSTQAWR